MKGPIKKNHFIWLTLAMVGMMLTGALSRDISENLTLELLEYSSLGLLLLSLFSLNTDRKLAKGLILIIGIMLAMVVVRGTTEWLYLEYSYLFMLLLFLVAAAVVVGSEVLLTGEVDLNIIVGSIALYLLIGFIWAIFYTILLEFSPGALNGIEPGNWYDHMPAATYFSFVTLTTLGYGDITPVTPIAEILVVFEAVAGMFYLAVIVASLIGAIRNKSSA